jgi:acyl carrier protein
MFNKNWRVQAMSNENAVKEKIKGIIVSRLKDGEKIRTLEYDTPLLSLGIDSILALSILVEIEEEFNIEIDDSDLNMDKIRNISSFAELIDNYIA